MGPKAGYDDIIVAWNGSRESARALAEAMPFLYKAQSVTGVVVDEDDEDAVIGRDVVDHLKHHGVNAVLHHQKVKDDDVGEILIDVARRRKADLIVMGGYGHSRLREWLLGGTTYELMQEARRSHCWSRISA
jgi:nucleotide-binding universal stress UspA family protein